MSDTGVRHEITSPSGLSADFTAPLISNLVPRLSGRRVAAASMVCDFLVVTLGNLGCAVSYNLYLARDVPYQVLYLTSSLAFAFAFCLAGSLNGRYALRELENIRGSGLHALKLFNVLFAVFVCLLFLTKGTQSYSRASLVLQYGVTSLALLVARTTMARLLAGAVVAGRIEARRIALIGSLGRLRQFLGQRSQSDGGATVVSVFELPEWNGEEIKPQHIADTEALAARLTGELRRSNVDDIVIAMPWRAASLIEIFVRRLSALPAHVHLASDPELTFLRAPTMAQIGDQVTLSLSRPPLSALDRGVKRAFDIAFASLILLATAPLMLVIALAIKLDSPGPVLFRQQRHGFNQKPFRILKFRTMTTLDDGAVIVQARKGDARITRIGRVLRRTSLDELPQLLNVLKGDMSLVGPRPHALAHDREYEEKIALYAHRHNVKPGITGWAQVHGFRGETDVDWKMQKRVEFDLAYIDRWSLLLDIQILFLTVFSRKTFTNAH